MRIAVKLYFYSMAAVLTVPLSQQYVGVAETVCWWPSKTCSQERTYFYVYILHILYTVSFNIQKQLSATIQNGLI
jgi:hypothetical protein